MGLPEAFITKYEHLLGDEADAFFLRVLINPVPVAFASTPCAQHLQT